MAQGDRRQRLTALLAESRGLTRRKRKKLSAPALAELAALQGAAKEALASGDPLRIETAFRSLEEAFLRYLLPLRKSRARRFAETLAVAVTLAATTRFALVEPYWIPSGSMAPTLLPGDVVLVTKPSYGIRLWRGGREILPGRLPERGDLILFADPRDAQRRLVQRVVGLPGDVVEIVEQELRLNGEGQRRRASLDRFEYWSYRDDLAYWHPQSGAVWVEELDGRPHATLHSRLLPTPRPSDGPFHVPPGHLFVLGDNRDRADDGRSGGGWYLPVENVLGKVWRVGASWGPGGAWLWGDEGLRFDRLLRAPDARLPGA